MERVYKKIKIFFWEIFRPMPLDNNFNNYDEYWENRGFHAPALRKAKIISKYVEPSSKILDIGCGDGTIIEFLSKNNSPKEIIGIDISKAAVDYVKARGYRALKFDVFSEEFMNFIKDKKFDYIIITEVLEHVQDPEKIILSIKNNFNKAIYISIPNAGFFINRVRFLFGRFPLVMIQQHVKEHIRFWTLGDFKYWIKYMGLKVDKIIVSGGLFFKPLAFLEKLSPSLFGNQLLFRIIKINENK